MVPFPCVSASRNSLGLSSFGVYLVRCRLLKGTVENTHVSPHLLGIFEEVVVLLEVHARHAVEKISLQSQGNGSPGRVFDGVACLGNVDALNGLAVDLAVGRRDAYVGNQPVRSRSAGGDENWRVCGSVPDRRDAILRAREDWRQTSAALRAIIGVPGGSTYSRENKTSLRSTYASITRESYRNEIALDGEILFSI